MMSRRLPFSWRPASRVMNQTAARLCAFVIAELLCAALEKDLALDAGEVAYAASA